MAWWRGGMRGHGGLGPVVCRAGLLVALLTSLLPSFGAAAPAQATGAGRPPFRYGIVVSNSANYPLVTQMGFGWVKLFVSWNALEPTQGQIGGFPDNAVDTALANNLHVLALVYDTPAWANGTGVYNPNSPPPSADHVADFGTFMGALAAHYQGQVSAYEIWNEENVAVTWGNQNPDPARYVAMLQAAYPQIKQADPNALVISGGVANTGDGNGTSALGDLVYLQDILQLGAGNVVDAIGIHPYPGACDPTATSCAQTPGTYFQRAVDEHNTVVQYSSANLPMWITEAGYFSQPGNLDPAAAGCNGSNGLGDFTAYEVSESAKAAWMVQAYQYAYQNWPWLGMFMMMNLDFSTISGYATCDPVRFWSILQSNGTPTAAYTALQAMVKDAPLISFPNWNATAQVSGTVTISGSLGDPSQTAGVTVDGVVAAVDGPYGTATQLAQTSLTGGGGFTITVDVTHLSYGPPGHLLYVYVHTPADGWVSAWIGFTVAPQMWVTPESITLWLPPGSTQASTIQITLGRNDGNAQTFGWNSTANAAWLATSPNPGSAPNASTIAVTINPASLGAGLHQGTITINGDQGWFQDPTLTVPVTLILGNPHNIELPSIISGPSP
jgi:hypothetical protein